MYKHQNTDTKAFTFIEVYKSLYKCVLNVHYILFKICSISSFERFLYSSIKYEYFLVVVPISECPSLLLMI